MIKSILDFVGKNYHPTSLTKRIGHWEVHPTTLIKLPQTWVVCIEKSGPNNFVQFIKILQSVHCQLMTKLKI